MAPPDKFLGNCIMLSISPKEAANCSLKYTKRVRFFSSAVSIYFGKAAGILLSFGNAINEHRHSAIFAGD